MHLTETELGNGYNHHGDYSGEIRFSARVFTDIWEQRELEAKMPVADVGSLTNVDGRQWLEVSIPFKDMLELVADCLRSQRISALEQASTRDILGLG